MVALNNESDRPLSARVFDKDFPVDELTKLIDKYAHLIVWKSVEQTIAFISWREHILEIAEQEKSLGDDPGMLQLVNRYSVASRAAALAFDAAWKANTHLLCRSLQESLTEHMKQQGAD